MADDILDKVRKILAKAEDPAATPQEAETYTAKAAELIATYGIDRALLARSDPASDVVGDRVVALEPPYALDKASLLGIVASRLRCRSVQRVDYWGGRKRISLHLFGYDSDLARAELLYTSLLLQAASIMTRTPVPYGENAAAFRRSWLAGFTGAISQRLADTEARATREAESRATGSGQADAPSMSLVLADRSAAVETALGLRYPRLRTAPPRRLSGNGGREGWVAGQQADLAMGRGLRQRAPGELTR